MTNQKRLTMQCSRVRYVRRVLKKNGVNLKAVFSPDMTYWPLRDSDSKFANFTTEEIHLAILGAR